MTFETLMTAVFLLPPSIKAICQLSIIIFCNSYFNSVQNIVKYNKTLKRRTTMIKDIELLYEKELLKSFNSFEIPKINDDINFWMIRTKQGFFYDEFVKDSFIALAWNIIDNRTDFTNTDILSKTIKSYYPEVKRPKTVINKCMHFILDVKEGDIILIPSKGTSYISIAIAGPYYEDTTKNYDTEKESISEIENGVSKINQIKCPYKKRRHISIIKTLPSALINYHLYRSLTSYHGICNLKEYATAILNHAYPCYFYNDDLHLTFNIRTTDAINIFDLSSFLNSTSQLFFNHLHVPSENIKATINLNSPGDISLWIIDAYHIIQSNAIPLLIMLMILTGGSISTSSFDIETPSILKTIKDILTIKTDIEIKKEELKAAKNENKSKELDNTLKKIAIKKQLDEAGYNFDDLESTYDSVANSVDKLKISSNVSASHNNSENEQSNETNES